MSYLSKVTKGVTDKRMLLLLYGPEGVGKSSFAANANKPIFLGTEGGTENLDIARLPEPKSWDDVLGMLKELAQGDHDYNTLVIDTLDWLEPILFHKFTKGKTPIEDTCGSFGKWVGEVTREYRNLMSYINEVRSSMDVIILAHSHLRTINDPVNNASYDRYELKLHNKQHSALWKEYVDCLIFANFEVFTKTDNPKGKSKAYGNGERKMFTEHRPSFDAKNRDSLPFEMELSYDDLKKAIASGRPESAEKLVSWINERLKLVDNNDIIEATQKHISSNIDNPVKLRALLDRLIEKTSTVD